MKNKYIYSGKASDVTSAAGVSGVLIKLRTGGHVFRVYSADYSYTDYQINHDDLSITIDADSLASFYSHGESNTLDHSPEVFQLKQCAD